MQFRKFIFLELSVERAEKIILGIAHDVNSIAILTPMNPQARKFPNVDNNLFVSQFLDMIRSNGYDPIRIDGKYAGNEEKSFLIKNISRKKAVELGRMYDQQSIIWGRKQFDDGERPHFHYEFIENGKTTSSSYRLSLNAKDREDNYSKIRGKKFIIPFFQPDSQNH